LNVLRPEVKIATIAETTTTINWSLKGFSLNAAYTGVIADRMININC